MNCLQTFEECVEEAIRMVHGDFPNSHALLRCGAYCTGVLRGFYISGAVGEEDYTSARDSLWHVIDRRTQRLADWYELDEAMRRSFGQDGRTHDGD